MGVKLDMTYSKSLEDYLKQGLITVDDTLKVVRTNTAEMQENAERKAPVDTGHLKREIHQDIKGEGAEVVGQVSGDADYDPYQEYGTRYQPGTPHIRPAYYEQRDKFVKGMSELVKPK
ncbi:HK97-gp10 family putative phage morphogenesis protein [Companilactobacillus nodensis]|uniref:HK97 gp10 family phage protein n=1 Tax=Companilactobacillus nodensis DSM 19682 = JCM 14932 = NBRC 107160 TaxID=1423775 RepID=A0A0R1KI68_9LACO|nr:HK97-gp10 family putative phage morphogenesis protein [Companilactobacillus nodensis]KRK80225.1 hypothetical protein FD03_GL002615 [Companilactobacillus nodensis DSM 19682 = JCM 14932 = NBRC 107160]